MEEIITDADLVIAGRNLDKPNILMVDDRPENLVALGRLLGDLPVNLFKATSGNEALRLTLHHDFALALLDIQMPQMDGYELAEFLRQEEKTQHMPFIFISAIYTDSINIFQGYEKGAFSYITKPFEPEVLLNKVRFFIEKHQQEVALKENTRKLQAMNEELESFSYSVSHDLRAPLRAIDGFSKVLQKKASDQLDESNLGHLNTIVENVDKMKKLIDDMLAFSKMSRQEQKTSVFDPKQLIEEVFEEEKQVVSNSKVEISIGEIPRIEADKDLIRQVFNNLIGNAIKYSSTKENPKIEVEGKNEGTETIISIKDNGVGFDEEYADKLFKIFQRLHDADEFEGTGVGLAIVKKIVDRHGGRVWAEAELDKGATFYIALPKYDD
ncbi:ATP-binding protein [Ekhidna sp.]|uniref:sensor histidine kinase n=1 Tax=Ekhidna sp. TaxID=2608089 RepID=UPI0032EEB42B